MSSLATDDAKPGQRLERLGRSVSRKPPGGPPELTAKHKLLVDYQINGCPHRDLLKRIKRQKAVMKDGEPSIGEVSPEPFEPLTLIEAADVLRIRRRNARQLTALPVYQQHMAAEVRRYRDGEHLASLQTIAAVRDEPGDNKAADRKVRLEAAKTLIGESGDRVTVNMPGSNPKITAGIVIRMPPGRRSHADPPPPPRTIEHEREKTSEVLREDQQ